MGMKSEGARERLLRTGMGCFAFAAGMTLVNALVLPIARANHGYRAAVALPAFVLAGAAYGFVIHCIQRTDSGRLERVRRIAVPAYLAVLFIVQIILGYLMEYVPAGDNFMIYNGSALLASDGCFDRYPDFELYLARYSNQWGFLLFFAAMWKLFGLLGFESIFMPMVVVQAALYIPGILCALSMARRTRGVRAELVLLMLLATCLPMYLAAGVLYTDTFSMPFVMMTLYLALRVMQEEDARRRLCWAAACALMAALGGMIKMTVAIVLIAAVICWLLCLRPVHAAACAALCAVILFAGNGAVERTLLSGPIDRQMYQQHNTPKIHWVMMSIPSSDNPYGGYCNEYGPTWEMMENGASREEIMDSIYTRMKDKIYTLRYPDRLILAALRKNAAAFGDGTFGMTEMLDDNPVRLNAVSNIVLAEGRHYPLYQGVASGVFFAQLLMAIFACWRDIRRRDLRMAMGYVAAFGMLLFLMLWEARARYFFGFVPVILLLASRIAEGREEDV